MIRGYLVYVPFGDVASMEYGNSGQRDKATVATTPGSLAGPFEVATPVRAPETLADERGRLAGQVIAGWFDRTGQPADMDRDAAYQLQWTTLRMVLDRLEDVLGGLRFDRDLTRQILAAMLDDAPSADDAEARMREFARAVREAKKQPPAPILTGPAQP